MSRGRPVATVLYPVRDGHVVRKRNARGFESWCGYSGAPDLIQTLEFLPLVFVDCDACADRMSGRHLCCRGDCVYANVNGGHLMDDCSEHSDCHESGCTEVRA